MTVAIPPLLVEPVVGAPMRAVALTAKPVSGGRSTRPDTGGSSFYDALKSAERDLRPRHREPSPDSGACDDAQPSRDAAQPARDDAQDRSTGTTGSEGELGDSDANPTVESAEPQAAVDDASDGDAPKPDAAVSDNPLPTTQAPKVAEDVPAQPVATTAKPELPLPSAAAVNGRASESADKPLERAKVNPSTIRSERSAPTAPQIEAPSDSNTTAAAETQTAPSPTNESPRETPAVDAPATAQSGASRTVEAQTKPAPPAIEGAEATRPTAGDPQIEIEPKPPAAVAPQSRSDSETRANCEPSTPANQAPSMSASVQSSPSAGGNPSSDANRRESGGRKQNTEGAKPVDASAGADRSPVQALKLTLEPAQKLPAAAQLSPTTAQNPASANAEEAVRANAAGIVSRGLAAVVQQRGGQMTVRLTPESLGQVKVQMSLDHGTVAVRLEAANEAARGLLSEHLGMLRGSLESRGLSVEKLSVHLAAPGPGAGSGPGTGPGGGSSGADGGAQERNAFGGQDGRHDAGGAPSRGRDGGEREPEGGPSRLSFAGGEAPMDGAEPTEFVSRLRLSLHAIA